MLGKIENMKSTLKALVWGWLFQGPGPDFFSADYDYIDIREVRK